MNTPNYFALVSNKLFGYWNPDTLLIDVVLNKQNFNEDCTVFKVDKTNTTAMTFSVISMEELRKDVNEYNLKLSEAYNLQNMGD